MLVKGGLTLAQLGDFTGADDLFARAFEWSPNLDQVYAFYGSRLQLGGAKCRSGYCLPAFEPVERQPNRNGRVESNA
jgi:hypothetical protein